MFLFPNETTRNGEGKMEIWKERERKSDGRYLPCVYFVDDFESD